MGHLAGGHACVLSKVHVYHSIRLKKNMKIAIGPTNFSIWWGNLRAPAFQADIPMKLNQKPYRYLISGVQLESSSGGVHVLNYAHIQSYLECTFAL
jgi:hypothetical protein